MAASRSELERKKLEVQLGLESRPSLKNMFLKEHGVLFNSSNVYDMMMNFWSNGRIPLKQSPLCYMGGCGVVWQTKQIMISVSPVQLDLHDAVVQRSNRNIGDSLNLVRIGTSVTLKDLNSGKSLPNRYLFIDLDDPLTFLCFFEDSKMWKRFETIPLDNVLNSKFDLDHSFLTVQCRSSLYQIRDVDHDFLFSLALVLAHTSKK